MENKEKGYVLTYDRSALPSNMTMKEVMDKIHNEGICIYDSTNLPDGVKATVLINLGGNKNSKFKYLKYIDVKNKSNL